VAHAKGQVHPRTSRRSVGISSPKVASVGTILLHPRGTRRGEGRGCYSHNAMVDLQPFDSESVDEGMTGNTHQKRRNQST